jgi:hypothetical protein
MPAEGNVSERKNSVHLRDAFQGVKPVSFFDGSEFVNRTLSAWPPNLGKNILLANIVDGKLTGTQAAPLIGGLIRSISWRQDPRFS